MKNSFLISLTSAFVFAFGGASFADTITLEVKTSSADGKMRAALYDSQASYDAREIISGVSVDITEGTTVLEFKDIKAGTYGVALFQDINGNEDLDTSMLGAPNEPFGFSNNPKIGFSAPAFDAFSFDFDGNPLALQITLNGE